MARCAALRCSPRARLHCTRHEISVLHEWYDRSPRPPYEHPPADFRGLKESPYQQRGLPRTAVWKPSMAHIHGTAATRLDTTVITRSAPAILHLVYRRTPANPALPSPQSSLIMPASAASRAVSLMMQPFWDDDHPPSPSLRIGESGIPHDAATLGRRPLSLPPLAHWRLRGLMGPLRRIMEVWKLWNPRKLLA